MIAVVPTLTAGAALLGAAVLYFSISRIPVVLRDAEVARVPAAAEQNVTFAQPGTYILHIEQPRLNMAMRSATFQLRDESNGQLAPSSAVIFRITRSGFATARISLRRFEIGRAASYRLEVAGVAPGADLSQVELIFTRPYAGILMSLIIGVLLGSGCLIAGLVVAALRFSGKW